MLKTALGLEETIDEQHATLAGAFKQTITPTVNVRGANARAHPILSRPVENRHKSLTLGATLGEGGMGIVRSARQADLGRSVAVKTLREELASDEATGAMLREAWVTGSLEHPNIVPVYYVDADEHGRPLIVLKRIEGTVWSSLIGDGDAVHKEAAVDDLLAWNLAVFEKVINAVRYAHKRGVVHRDLKPDNIMVGEFGEVYVLDWGIAVSLVDDGETLLPLASQIDQMAGTPAFMAPEMLGEAVDERTDVYLLGAILYQIIADVPPHAGLTIEQVVASIRSSSPSFPPSAPAELCAVCRKAMAARPEDRYASAEELGRAIREFIAHRGSLQLLHRAQAHLETLRHRIMADAASDELHELLGECRYGFQSSLEVWTENREAQAGLCEAVELVAELELHRGDPRIAASILREIATPNPILIARVKEATDALDESEQRMARIGQQLDRGLGKRTRVLVLALLGTIWIGLELWAQLTGNVDRYASHNTMLIGSLLSLIALGAIVLGARETLTSTVINRQLGGALFTLLATQSLVSAVAPALDMTPTQAQIVWMLIWTVVATMVTVTIERRMVPLAAMAAICFVIASVSTPHRIYAMMVVTATMVLNALVIWWPDSPQDGSQNSAPTFD